ncbi:hypothetical protein Tco_1526994, partial [Tanacetum coccineum]
RDAGREAHVMTIELGASNTSDGDGSGWGSIGGPVVVNLTEDDDDEDTDDISSTFG